MQYRRLGRTNLRVSIVGLGSGGPSHLGQTSGVTETDAQRLLRHALDTGINLIDTAADYKNSEAILGRALTGVARDAYVLCTKFKAELRARDPQGKSQIVGLKDAREMRESLEQSLRSLGTEYVDVFQLHGVPADWFEPIRERFIPVMQQLRQEGKCRYIGITDAFSDQDHRRQLMRAVAEDEFDTVMVAYNILTPGPERDILPAAIDADRGVIVMCAVRTSIGRPRALEELLAELKDAGELARDALSDVGPLDWLLGDDVPSIPAAAYKFVAGHPAVSCVLTGTANIDHLDENVRAVLGPPLADEHRRRLMELFGPIDRKLG